MESLWKNKKEEQGEERVGQDESAGRHIKQDAQARPHGEGEACAELNRGLGEELSRLSHGAPSASW